jgi:predicted nucleic acid-binding protein
LIYIDTSVVLAQLLAEDRRPPLTLWSEPILSSRLLEYETWTRIHARRLAESHGDAVRELLGRVSFLELSPIVLARALEPFPMPLRTLDALHLASVEYLRAQRLKPRLATYDRRLTASARRLRIPLVSLGRTA